MTTSLATRKFEMVAVPQPKLRSAVPNIYALGVRSTADGAAYVLGAQGPEHLDVQKLYFTSGDKEFEIDFERNTLTVADKARLRVTVYPIDIEAMNGHVIEHNAVFTVVLADEERTERPLKVNRWVAATAPTFSREAMPEYVTAADSIAVSISATVNEAQRANGLKTISAEAPAAIATSQRTSTLAIASGSGTQVVDLRDTIANLNGIANVKPHGATAIDAAETDDADHGEELVDDGSYDVIVPDPITGARYRGREWRKQLAKQHELTLLHLRESGYRVVIVEMEHDRSATIALNDPNGKPVISIMTNPSKPPVERFLTEETWNQRFGPGTSLHFGVASMLDDSPAPEHGDLSTPAIARITATASPVRRSETSREPVTDTLAKHRKLVALQARHHQRHRDDEDALVRIATR